MDFGTILSTVRLRDAWISERAAEAAHAKAQMVDRLLLIACAGDCRLAIATNPEIVEDSLVWHHVMLQPGEKPPEGRAWTVYEYREDFGWQGRSA